MVDFYNLYVNSLLNAGKEEELNQRYLRRQKQRLLGDPDNIDKMAAAITSQLSPTAKKPKKGKFAAESEAVDSVIPEDHPMKGFSMELRDNLYKVFTDRRTQGGDISTVAQETASWMLSRPGRRGTRYEGVPRFVASHEYKRREEGMLWGGKNLASPTPRGFPNYEQWLQYVQGREKSIHEKKHWVEKNIAPPGELLTAAGAGAVVGGLMGGPPGAVVGAGAVALTELIAKPIRSWISTRESYKSKAGPLTMTSDWWDKVKAHGILYSPDFALGMTAEAMILKTLLVPKTLAAARPTAENILKARQAGEKSFREAMKNKSFVQRMGVRFTHDRGLKIASREERHLYKEAFKKAKEGDKEAQAFVQSLKLPEAQVAAEAFPPLKSRLEDLVPGGRGASVRDLGGDWKKVLNKLDVEATEEMVNSTEGPLLSAFKAYERQVRRKLFEESTAMEHADELIHVRHRESMKVADKAAEKISKVIDRTEVRPLSGVEDIVEEIPTRPRVKMMITNAEKEALRRRGYTEEQINKMKPQGAADILAKAPATVLKTITAQQNRYTKANSIWANRVTWKLPKKMSDRILSRVNALEQNPVTREVVEDTSSVTAREAEFAIPEPRAERSVKEAEIITGYKPKRKYKGKQKKPLVEVETVQGKRMVPKGEELIEKELAVERKAEELLDIRNIDDAEALGNEYVSMFGRKEITAEEGAAAMNRLTDSVMASDHITDEGKMAFLDLTDPFMSHLRKMMSSKAFWAAFAPVAGVLSMFLDVEETEASVFTGAVRGVRALTDIGVAKKALLGAMKEARYNVTQAVPLDQYILRSDEFQRGLRDSSSGGPTAILRNLPGWIGKRDVKLRHKLMGAYQFFEEVLNVGHNLMNNPAVFKASYQAAEYNNIRRARDVLRNIFREAGITSEPREVRRRFKPLVEDMAGQVEFEWRTAQVEKLDGEFKELRKSKESPDVTQVNIDINRANRDIHTNRLKDLEGSIEEYHKKWAAIAEQAAEDIPSVKIALALGDDSDFTKYPFLSKLHFSTDEKTLIGRLREQLLEYKTRLDDLGVDTKKGPFLPHVFHPDFTAKIMERIAGDSSAPAYMRIYRRSKHSRPLFPDIHNTMARYVSDMERRIQNKTFWNQGWDKVEKATQDIPAIHEAFKSLRDGVRPVDWNVHNRLSNMYIQFEVMKRLWLNPSAGLKHLVKATADIASVGFSESLEVTPITLTSVGRRLAQANPTISKKLASMDIKVRKQQNKMIDSYFKSLVPARDARQRMLDIGLHVSEEYFTDIKNVWNKSQNIGGAWINLAELVDRGLSVFSALDIAAKRGLTIEQALYGAYDLVLKNNFLSREFNPSWMRSPGIRAMLMFQGTPFKIMERRVINAIRGGRAIKRMTKAVYEATKTPEGRQILLRDLRGMRDFVKREEAMFKTNLFVDAIRSETDFFGTPIVNQFAKDTFIAGAGTIGGAYAGMSLWHHFFHVPFFSTMSYEPTVAFSPGMMAAFRGSQAYKQREEYDDEFLFTKIMQKWLGPGNAFMKAIPDTARKWKRLNEDDIPDIYSDSKFQYLFAIPGKEH